jgi:hypothetical protein
MERSWSLKEEIMVVKAEERLAPHETTIQHKGGYGPLVNKA